MTVHVGRSAGSSKKLKMHDEMLPDDQAKILQFTFTATLTLSAILLFWIQPMFAKMVLPMLGGTPAVWNTAMVFFQASLLAGYAYAHYSTKFLDLRRQSILHIFILASAFLVLPIAVTTGWSPPTETTPVIWLLALLTVSIGLPFFAISATAPLLQKWFSHTRHKDASNPYFLYAASNVGSIFALLSYPVLIEPFLGLVEQSWTWTASYSVLVALMVICAWLLRRNFVVDGPDQAAVAATGLETDVTARLRLRWVLLAFVPSSLLLGVTTHITTDVASVPLLWIVPLTLYLLTFVIVFSKKPTLPHDWMVKGHAYLVLIFVIALHVVVVSSLLTLLVHLLVFFVTAMVCHGELARRRPTTTHLTEFYLWMSAGGVLGGIFNALLAPVIFSSILEYPIAIVFACAMRPVLAEARDGRWAMDIILPTLLGCAVLAVFYLVPSAEFSTRIAENPLFIVAAVVSSLVVFSFSTRPLRFALGVGVLIIAAGVATNVNSTTLSEKRSFFGVHEVKRDRTGEFNYLQHGTTIHGAQAVDPKFWRDPLAYFTREGPVGQLFAILHAEPRPMQVGIMGMGTGAMACYKQADDDWVFYEIDPLILQVALDDRYFHYLEECAAESPMVLGDARLSLAYEPDKRFDLLVMDAFSSDSIPVNLITREAIDLYFRKLADDGLLLINISNRYLDLEPVLGNLAVDAKLVGRIQRHQPGKTDSAAESALALKAAKARFRYPSEFVVLARSEDTLGALATDQRWKPLNVKAKTGIWTDDYSNLVRVLRWTTNIASGD